MTGDDGVRVTTLDNGLRVASDPMTSVETVSLGAWVGIGARHEAPEVNGVSHVLEHMAFKGTERRTARAIAEEIEAVGGHLNAYTSHENTAYFAKVLKDDIGLAADIIADILQNAVMDPDELSRELAVIVQEIGHAHDTPDDIIFDHLQATAFPDQSLGRSVLGSAERVLAMRRETIIGHMQDHYSAARTIVAGAGQTDHDALVDLAQRQFRALPPDRPAGGDEARYVGGDYRESRDLEQVHVALGFEGLAFRDDDYYALSVFSTLFGGGMSSRLFQEVREKRGLAYSIHSFQSSYSDSGLFGIYAATGEADLAELIPVVCDEFARACETVDEKEVRRARTQLKAGMLMSLESTTARCERLARQLLVFGRHLPLDEVVAKIDAVDARRAAGAAKRIKASRPALAALGPIARLESFERVCERLG
ncbi:MAG: pitrilysin family protein [Rhodospirillales bacterium]|nr:pitrilysin family protein [Rhodospirillales bacterium]